jgi:hypothetical protein
MKLPFTTPRQAGKKKTARKKKTHNGDRLAQAIAILASVMAAAYIVIRLINWIRFL